VHIQNGVRARQQELEAQRAASESGTQRQDSAVAAGMATQQDVHSGVFGGYQGGGQHTVAYGEKSNRSHDPGRR
jgi:hypothetical protein